MRRKSPMGILVIFASGALEIFLIIIEL